MEVRIQVANYTPLIDLVTEMEKEYRKVDLAKADVVAEVREDLVRRIHAIRKNVT